MTCPKCPVFSITVYRMNIHNYIKSFGITDPTAVSRIKRNLPVTSYSQLLAMAMEKWIQHPVLFRPTKEMTQGMAQTEVTVPLSQYHQSYDAIMIQHPDGVLSLVATIQHPLAGKVLFAGHTLNIPDAIGGRFCFLVNIEGRGTMPNGQQARTIEDAIVVHQPILPNEQDQAHPYNRIAINSVLLLACYPTHQVRTEREKVYRKQAKGHHRAKAVAAKEKLGLLPQVIDFDNPPKFYREQGIPTGGTKRPHWRKGYYKMQAYGPRWKDHRQIFIEPVMIHDESVTDASNTVEYIGKDRIQPPVSPDQPNQEQQPPEQA